MSLIEKIKELAGLFSSYKEKNEQLRGEKEVLEKIIREAEEMIDELIRKYSRKD